MKARSLISKALTNPSKWSVLSDAFTVHDISLSRTLQGGQCFTWRRLEPNIRASVLQDSKLSPPSGGRRRGLVTIQEATLSDCYPSFIGAFEGDVVQLGYEATTGKVIARAFTTGEIEDSMRRSLLHYLSANEDLGALLAQWRSSGHPITALLPKPTNAAKGKTNSAGPCISSSPVRLLKQDFIECFFSFLCSQNNNVKRIAGMVLRMGEGFGTPLGNVTMVPDTHSAAASPSPIPRKMRRIEVVPSNDEAKSANRSSSASIPAEDEQLHFYAFPTIEQLRSRCTDEDQLRAMGFGYRARYVVECARTLTPEVVQGLLAMGKDEAVTPNAKKSIKGKPIIENEEDWAARTSRITEEKRKVLTSFCGVGRKVADCVLLFSLGERTLVPIDTHMAQLAMLYFKDEIGTKTEKPSAKAVKSAAKAKAVATEEVKEPALTPAMHNKMQACFLKAFGREAGWAHSFLFSDRIGEQK